MDTSILLLVFYGILVLIAVLLGYWFLRMAISRRDLLSEQATVSRQQDVIIGEAHVVANKIVSEAKSQSSEIEDLRKKMLMSYENKLSQITDEVLQTYTKSIGEEVLPVKQRLGVVVNELGDEARVTMQTFVHTYADEVKNLTNGLTSELRTYTVTAKEVVDKEMANYRAKLKEGVEKDVSNSVKELSLKIFSGSLSVEHHEDLVKKAIETAKKEGVFN